MVLRVIADLTDLPAVLCPLATCWSVTVKPPKFPNVRAAKPNFGTVTVYCTLKETNELIIRILVSLTASTFLLENLKLRIENRRFLS